MSAKLSNEALEQLFTKARTHNGWRPEDVPDALLREAVDIAKWGPTSANGSPMRVSVSALAGGEATTRARAHSRQSRKDHGRAGRGDRRL